MINSKEYEVVELMGTAALFTTLRISNSDVPIGLFRYELRHEDDDGMTPCEVSYQIAVNHFGTVLTNKPIKMQHNGWAVFDGDESFNFTNEHLTVQSYKKKYQYQAARKKKEQTR